jgi:hypothetical protein
MRNLPGRPRVGAAAHGEGPGRWGSVWGRCDYFLEELVLVLLDESDFFESDFFDPESLDFESDRSELLELESLELDPESVELESLELEDDSLSRLSWRDPPLRPPLERLSFL